MERALAPLLIEIGRRIILRLPVIMAMQGARVAQIFLPKLGWNLLRRRFPTMQHVWPRSLATQ